ncbi:integrase [Orientia tsutsugamushi]|nr:integrase [Orientia tsutsugamushi]
MNLLSLFLCSNFIVNDYNYGKPLYLKKISKIKMNDIESIFNAISKEGKYAIANLLLLTFTNLTHTLYLITLD